MEQLGLAMHSRHEREMREFAANLADLVTLFVFLVLGANIPFDDLGANLLPALAVVAALILLARPLTVFACTAARPRRRLDAQRAGLPLLDARDGGRPRRRWSGCLPGWGFPTPTCTRASSRWR